jgi:hypothetical protein
MTGMRDARLAWVSASIAFGLMSTRPYPHRSGRGDGYHQTGVVEADDEVLKDVRIGSELWAQEHGRTPAVPGDERSAG